MTLSGLAVEDFTPSLGPRTEAAADDPRVVLFAVYQLGQLVAERRRVSGEDFGDGEMWVVDRLPEEDLVVCRGRVDCVLVPNFRSFCLSYEMCNCCQCTNLGLFSDAL